MSSTFRGSLAVGCEQCLEGRKMVLFVTGRCRFRCFYCPVSERRNQIDVTYANERLVERDEDVLEEARSIGAAGTGITGGDPLGVIDRTVHYVELLKREFGPEHHIHLYTHEPNPEKLARLARAGLDEFRLHVPSFLWGDLAGAGSAYRRVLEEAPSWGVRRGVEVPVLPGKVPELRRLLLALGRIGVDFVNLNELEFSPTNERKMWERGYRQEPKGGWGVVGSQAAARELVRRFSGSLPVHFCSSGFKDGVQLRRRLQRRAERTALPFHRITPDGTLVKGIVEVPGPSATLEEVRQRLDRSRRVPPDRYRVDERRRRVEVDPVLLRRVARTLPFPCFEVEEYPTADALEVERTPLNRAAFPSRRPTGG
ncbi:MAG: radical SAM protein [Euryarchaeota archaeon]|nr:radical SAM protein [Euryarchaeota archaeon]MDE1835126.1 radical SAM protein [Euryarchaeota archaeon]MDE1880688.1 radical SAM protein [Euryarchaeota archaeon]MDE2044911.1 radical SAM protein [Thermoplasmata archaeon]